MELRGFEPLTYSMRTSRATNCAIAPWSVAGYQQSTVDRKRLSLTRRARKIEFPGERHVVQVLEHGVFVVDLQHRGTRPP